MTLMIEPVFMRATRQGANFIVILISLVALFKTQISAVVSNVLKKVTDNAKKI